MRGHEMKKLFVFTLLAVGCTKPSAMSVCEKIVGANCRKVESAGLNTASNDAVMFDLNGIQDKTGQVMTFTTVEAYDKTVENHKKFAALAGPHRYGNRERLVFVQINREMSDTNGKKVKAVIDEL
jgi:hypothetical protein